MESTRLSECLRDYLTAQATGAAVHQPEWIQGALEVVGQFFYGLVLPTAWHLLEIQRLDRQALVWYWTSMTEQAVCPTCHAVSRRRTKTYWTRRPQDLPCAGMTVYHVTSFARQFVRTHNFLLGDRASDFPRWLG